ncbi:MAG TPA: pyruvate, phosphate dikinase, partial [Desulfarculaceae bacterium]|nr:pyruvate, phosphate dikinase [Desulfarculaceae bacterium]
MSGKFVYSFGGDYTEGDASMKNLLGGKGANLAEMIKIGVPVPPGFTITTETCVSFYENQRNYPEVLQEQVREAMRKTETTMDKGFGSNSKPLLFSVRSGARVSMPGMMDT